MSEASDSMTSTATVVGRRLADGPGHSGRGRDGLDGADVRVGEDRQALEHPLLGGLEERVAPVDRGPQRLLALGDVARRAAEELEAAAQAIAQRLRREEAETSRGELDGEREPVEPAADLDDRRRVVVGDREVGPDRARPVDEQLDRLDPLHAPRPRRGGGSRAAGRAAAPGRRARSGRGAARGW